MTPADIPVVNRFLRRAYAVNAAPIVEFIQIQTRDPFKVLVTTILSARTQDQTTSRVALRLFERVKNLADLRAIPEAELAGLLFPVGFYRMKARHLKRLPDTLDREFAGVIPDTVETLCRLPGVGRKTANLVVAIAFDRPAVCVDVHVHRISNRLGLVTTKTPFDTEMALRATVPRRYWKTWNSYLVSYGQTVCRPTRPHCSTCAIRAWCARRGVTASR